MATARSVSPTRTSSPRHAVVGGERQQERRCARCRRPAPTALAVAMRAKSCSRSMLLEVGRRRRRRASRRSPRRPGPTTRAPGRGGRWPGARPKSSSIAVKMLARLLEDRDRRWRPGRSRGAPSRSARASSRAAQRSPRSRIVVEDLLGHRLGLEAVALLEAGPGEQADGPALARPCRRAPRTWPAAARSCCSASSARPEVERAPRQVLLRPRHAPAVAERLEAAPGRPRAARWPPRSRSGTARRSRAGAAPRPRRTGRRARRTAPAASARAASDSSQAASFCSMSASASEGLGEVAPRPRRRRPATRRWRPSRRRGRRPSSRSWARARAAAGEEGAVLRAVLAGQEAQALAVEPLGHHRQLGLVGPRGGPLEPGRARSRDVVRQSRRPVPELGDQLGGPHVVVRDAVEHGVLGRRPRGPPSRRRCRRGPWPGRPS